MGRDAVIDSFEEDLTVGLAPVALEYAEVIRCRKPNAIFYVHLIFRYLDGIWK